jgi:cell division transport system permease protein
MKLVGATNRFIRTPFFLEGVFLAATGTLFAIVVLGFGYSYLIDNVKPAMAFLPIITDNHVLLNLFLGLGLTGIVLGIVGTFISVNKFLDV